MLFLFVCKGNAGRSQMAEALFKKIAKRHKCISAGTEAEKRGKDVNMELPETVIKCMKKEDIDLTGVKRKQLTLKMVRDANKIIVINEPEEQETNPNFLKKSNKVIYWSIPDAKGTPLKFHDKVRDMVKKKIEELVRVVQG
ncbi:low molecular weight phosphatase family protein [Candidatus Aenigmatarchaeota archaeon]